MRTGKKENRMKSGAYPGSDKLFSEKKTFGRKILTRSAVAAAAIALCLLAACGKKKTDDPAAEAPAEQTEQTSQETGGSSGGGGQAAIPILENSVLLFKEDKGLARLRGDMESGETPVECNVLYDEEGGRPDVTVADPEVIRELYTCLAAVTVGEETDQRVTDCYHHITFRLRNDTYVGLGFEGENLLSWGQENYTVRGAAPLWAYVRMLQDEAMEKAAQKSDSKEDQKKADAGEQSGSQKVSDGGKTASAETEKKKDDTDTKKDETDKKNDEKAADRESVKPAAADSEETQKNNEITPARDDSKKKQKDDEFPVDLVPSEEEKKELERMAAEDSGKKDSENEITPARASSEKQQKKNEITPSQASSKEENTTGKAFAVAENGPEVEENRIGNLQPAEREAKQEVKVEAGLYAEEDAETEDENSLTGTGIETELSSDKNAETEGADKTAESGTEAAQPSENTSKNEVESADSDTAAEQSPGETSKNVLDAAESDTAAEQPSGKGTGMSSAQQKAYTEIVRAYAKVLAQDRETFLEDYADGMYDTGADDGDAGKDVSSSIAKAAEDSSSAIQSAASKSSEKDSSEEVSAGAGEESVHMEGGLIVEGAAQGSRDGNSLFAENAEDEDEDASEDAEKDGAAGNGIFSENAAAEDAEEDDLFDEDAEEEDEEDDALFAESDTEGDPEKSVLRKAAAAVADVDERINYELVREYFMFPEGNKVFFGLKDYNADGVQELVIALGNDQFRQVWTAYTFDGKKAVELFRGQYQLGERTVLYTLPDNSFLIRASGGAFSGGDTICRIRKDRSGLEILAQYEYDEMTNGNLDRKATENHPASSVDGAGEQWPSTLTDEEFQERVGKKAASPAEGISFQPVSADASVGN